MSTTAPLWATSCYGESTETTPMELAALGQHLAQCSATSARMGAVQCGALRLHGFITSRLVTTLAAGAALIGLCVLVL
jgi:hypothetical protein